MKMYVYILKSLESGIHYVGMAEDLERRLSEHNKGRSKFTSGHRPWKLIYSEEVSTRADARKLEKYYKSGIGREKLKEILDL